MTISRREFLVGCSSAIAAMAGGRIGGLVFAQPQSMEQRDIFVFVFLRGGSDGLSLVAPTNDDNYVNNRGTLRVEETAELVLANPIADVGFCLHPQASALKELYDSQDLAIIHACGLTNGTRSHFDAMDYMERGTPDNKHTSTGWLTRHLSSLNEFHPIPALAASSALPASLLGSNNAIATNSISGFKISGHTKYGPQQQEILERVYNGSSALHRAGKTTLNTVAQVQSHNPGNYEPDVEYPSDYYVSGLSNSLKSVAQMIKMDMGLQVATIDYGGWDTHDNQVGAINNQINGLSRAVHAFYNDLTAYHNRLTVVVMSEFGRRLKANRSNGTDHGHGNAAFVLGGNVNGGRMFGTWPGLATEQLDNRVDLAITTDYRTILSEILVRRLSNPRLGMIFPAMETYNPLGIVRGTDLPIDFSGQHRVYLPYVSR